MSYAKKNLREVEDMAVRHGLSDTQEARFPAQTWVPSRPASTT